MKNLFFISLISILLFSCSDESNEPAKLTKAKVLINHIFNNEMMLFNDGIFVNESGDSLSILKVRYILSNISLTKTNGKALKFDSLYAFIDAARSINTFEIPNIEKGSYSKISFDIGVDSIMNHSDPSLLPASHPLSLINHNLHWGWIDGYIFLSIEGYLHFEEKQQSFTYHFGLDKSKRRVSVEGDIIISDNSQINIDFDVSSLFKTPNTINQFDEVYITHSTNDNDLSKRMMDNTFDAFSFQGMLNW